MSLQVQTLFSSVTATGPQTGITLPIASNQFTFSVVVNSGTLGNIEVDLEGSLDNATWSRIHSAKNAMNIHTSAQMVRDYFQYVRGNITTLTGSSPNISCYIIPISHAYNV